MIQDDIEPGDRDPAIPNALAESLCSIADGVPKSSPYARIYLIRAQCLEERAQEMEENEYGSK